MASLDFTRDVVLRWDDIDQKHIPLLQEGGVTGMVAFAADGYLAAATETLPEFDPQSEDLSVSSVPDALVLFNPAIVFHGKADNTVRPTTRFRTRPPKRSARSTSKRATAANWLAMMDPPTASSTTAGATARHTSIRRAAWTSSWFRSAG